MPKKIYLLLSKRSLPNELIVRISTDIDALNSSELAVKKLTTYILEAQDDIFTTLEKELNLVRETQYRNIGLPLVMAAFGIPLGVIFMLSLDNMDFIGLPWRGNNRI